MRVYSKEEPNVNTTICIAGKNAIAVDVLIYCLQKWPQNKILCITNCTETGKNIWQRSLKWFAERNGVEIVRLSDVYEIENLLFLSLEFDRIIRPEKFKSKDLYNIHFSLLPQYKGMYTSALPILHGKSVSGVTLHRINQGIDTGDIIEQTKIEICDDDSALDLYEKYLDAGTKLVIKNIESMIKGKTRSYPQEKRNSTYFSKGSIAYSQLRLDVNRTAFQVKNQIRAFSFRPYQLLSWHETRYMDCMILDKASTEKPGTILHDTNVFTEIATVDYDVRLYKDVLKELLDAIREGKNHYAKELCASRKIIESREEHGWYPLTVAVYFGNMEMIRYLTAMGADVQIRNNNGTTLLMYAKSFYQKTGVPDIFEFLMEQDLDVNQKDYYGKEVGDYCVCEGITSIGKYAYRKASEEPCEGDEIQGENSIRDFRHFIWYQETGPQERTN